MEDKNKITVRFKLAIGYLDDEKLASFDFVFNKEVDELDENDLLQEAGEYLSTQLENYLNEHYGK